MDPAKVEKNILDWIGHITNLFGYEIYPTPFMYLTGLEDAAGTFSNFLNVPKQVSVT